MCVLSRRLIGSTGNTYLHIVARSTPPRPPSSTELFDVPTVTATELSGGKLKERAASHMMQLLKFRCTFSRITALMLHLCSRGEHAVLTPKRCGRNHRRCSRRASNSPRTRPVADRAVRRLFRPPGEAFRIAVPHRLAIEPDPAAMGEFSEGFVHRFPDQLCELLRC
jgi:hypothetical protein